MAAPAPLWVETSAGAAAVLDGAEELTTEAMVVDFELAPVDVLAVAVTVCAARANVTVFVIVVVEVCVTVPWACTRARAGKTAARMLINCMVRKSLVMSNHTWFKES